MSGYIAASCSAASPEGDAPRHPERGPSNTRRVSNQAERIDSAALSAIMNVMSWLKVYGEMECSIDIGDSTITDLHCLGNSN